MMTITNFGYRCKKELEEPMDTEEQTHILMRFVNIAELELSSLKNDLSEYYRTDDDKNLYLSYPKSSMEPFPEGLFDND